MQSPQGFVLQALFATALLTFQAWCRNFCRNCRQHSYWALRFSSQRIKVNEGNTPARLVRERDMVDPRERAIAYGKGQGGLGVDPECEPQCGTNRAAMGNSHDIAPRILLIEPRNRGFHASAQISETLTARCAFISGTEPVAPRLRSAAGEECLAR